MAKVDTAGEARSLKACCLVSQMLEEMGLDSRKAREVRRQTLLGLMTFCQWQLARLDETTPAADPGEPQKRRGRRVKVV